MRLTSGSSRAFLSCLGLAVPFALSGCGGGGSAAVEGSAAVLIPASNGLEFAEIGKPLSDVEDRDMRVVLVRATSDYDRDYLGVRVSEETLRLAPGYISGGSRDMVLTLDGVPIAFVDGLGSAPNGQTLTRHSYLVGTDARIEGVYTYTDDDASGMDLEALFVVGLEANPVIVTARSGGATFSGPFEGFGHVANGNRVVIASEVKAAGEIELIADFDANKIGGDLTGVIEVASGALPFEGSIAPTAIDANGFASSVKVACPDGATCSGSSSLGGAFFGATGNEIAGLLALDETRRTGPGANGSLRYVGAAGFSLSED